MDKYSDYYNNFWDRASRTQAEEELRDREEAERRKIQEVQEQRLRQHRPRPAPGRKTPSPRTPAERQAAVARSAIRKSPPPAPAPPSNVYAGADPKTQEWLESFLRAKAQRGGRARSTGLKKESTSASNNTRKPMRFYSAPTPPAPAVRAYNRQLAVGPTPSSGPPARSYSPPTPPARAGRGYTAGSNFIEGLNSSSPSSSSEEDEDDVMPPPTSTRSPLYKNVPRPDAGAAPRKNSFFSLNPEWPVKKSTANDDAPGLFGSKSPTRPTTNTGSGLFTSGNYEPPPSKRSRLVPDYDSEDFDDATIEAIASVTRANARSRLGGRARLTGNGPNYGAFGTAGQAGLRRSDARREAATKSGAFGTAGQTTLARSNARRDQSGPGAFGTAGRTKLARSNARREQSATSGTQGTAGISGIRPQSRVSPRQGGTQGTAGVSGIRHRPKRVSPRQCGTRGTAGVSGIRHRPQRVPPRQGGTQGTAGVSGLQRRGAFHGRRPDESSEEWAARTFDALDSVYDRRP